MIIYIHIYLNILTFEHSAGSHEDLLELRDMLLGTWTLVVKCIYYFDIVSICHKYLCFKMSI